MRSMCSECGTRQAIKGQEMCKPCVTEKTTTGEVIHTCGWLHPEGTPCPPPKDKSNEDES